MLDKSVVSSQIRTLNKSPQYKIQIMLLKNTKAMTEIIICLGSFRTGITIRRNYQFQKSLKVFLVLLFSACAVPLTACGGGGDPQPKSSSVVALPSPGISVLDIHPAPVLSQGSTGAWDSVDVLNPSVIEWNGSLYNYYSGFDGSVWRTGLAISTDGGQTWNKKQTPVLDLGEWDKSYIAANGGAVAFNGHVYYYFQGLNASGHPEIGLAISDDAVSFSMKLEPVLKQGNQGSWDAQGVSDPYVVKIGPTFFLYFYAQGPTLDVPATLGVATSNDGIDWTKHNGPVIVGAKGAFDEFALGEPAVVYQGPYYYMIYTGISATHQRTLGWAYSLDGISWVKQGTFIPDSMRQAWDSQVICDPTIISSGKNDGTYYVWFGGGDKQQDSENLNGQIGLMTIKLR